MSPLIECCPGVCGGRPVIKGTRISVEHIHSLYFINDATVQQILEDYPQLTQEQVLAAINYYDHLPNVDDEA